MSMGGFLPDALAPVIEQRQTTGGKGGATMPEQASQPFVGSYATPAAQSMYFGGQAGQITDPTLAAQHAILGNRQPVQYQPLLTPETYQNFYTQQIATAPPAPLVVPNYRPMAQEFRQANVGVNGSSQYSLDGGGPEAMNGGSGGGWGAVNLNDMSSLAPVTTIDATTGQTTGVDGAVGAAGGFAPGVTGDTFGGEGDSAGGGGGSGCCFIMLEARYGDGTMDSVVRRYRDEAITPRNKRGYYKLAEVLVPLMRKSKLVKFAVAKLFADPLVSYGKWHYGENKHGWLFKPAHDMWMSVFNTLGSDTKFIRENGEIV